VITDLATGQPVLRYVAKRGYEGMDTWAGDEAVLRQSVHDLATDVTEILSRVQQHKPLK
jgi:hypothetical protein